MHHIPLCSVEEASREALAVYEEFYTQMRFPSAPNFIMTQGHSPTVTRGTWDLVRSVLVSGELPRWIKEMMFVAISKERNCRYCTAVHIACCRMLKVNPEWIELAVGGLQRRLKPAAYERLLTGLALCIGIEAFLVFRDIRGLSGPQATEASEWLALTVLRATLREGRHER